MRGVRNRVLRVGSVGGLGLMGLLVAVTAVVALAGPAAASQNTKAQLAQAKAALLVRSDFPSGWTKQGAVTTSNGGSSSFPGATQLASCLGVSQSLINLNRPSATSPTFAAKAGADSVTDNATVFSSTKEANQEFAAFASSKVPGCVNTLLAGPARQALLGNVGQGVTIGTISTATLPGSLLAGRSTGFAMNFPVTTNGVTLQAQITVITIVRGKAGSQISISTVGPPLPASLERHLVSVAYGRT